MHNNNDKLVTVTLPDVNQHALRQAIKGQKRLSHLLVNNNADFASILISGFKDRKLHYDLQLWCLENNEISRKPTTLTHLLIDEIIGSYAGMARDIAKRYPVNSQPSVLVMGSDGESLMFNPGRISGAEAEWLLDHIEGKSPAAMIIAKNSILNRIVQQ